MHGRLILEYAIDKCIKLAILNATNPVRFPKIFFVNRYKKMFAKIPRIIDWARIENALNPKVYTEIAEIKLLMTVVLKWVFKRSCPSRIFCADSNIYISSIWNVSGIDEIKITLKIIETINTRKNNFVELSNFAIWWLNFFKDRNFWVIIDCKWFISWLVRKLYTKYWQGRIACEFCNFLEL